MVCSAMTNFPTVCSKEMTCLTSQPLTIVIEVGKGRIRTKNGLLAFGANLPLFLFFAISIWASAALASGVFSA